MLAGWTASYGAGKADGWLLKLDNDGTERWNRTYGGPGNDRIVAIQPMADGYMLAGYTTSFGAGLTDLWLVRTDREGTERWNRTYGGIDHDNGWALCTVDDGFVVTGFTASYGAGNSDLWLLKLDNDGTERWNRTYGGLACETGFAIASTDDGYVIGGYYESCGGVYDLWLLATNRQGRERWNCTYGRDGREVARDMAVLNDAVAVTGWTTTYGSGGRDCWLLVTDREGIERVSRTYGGPGDDGGFSIASTDDGYAIAGFTSSYGSGGRDCWLFTTDSEGDIHWEHRAGGPGDDVAYAMAVQGRVFLMTGATASYGSGKEDLWLLRLADPQLSIEPRGGLGLAIDLQNRAPDNRADLAWSTALTGWVIPAGAAGVIDELPAGGSTTLAVPTFGFGPVAVTVTFGDVQRRAAYFSLGPLLLPGVTG